MAKKKKKRRDRTPNIPQTAAQPSTSPPTRRVSRRQRQRQRGWLWIGLAAAAATILVVAIILVSNASQSAGEPPVSSVPADLVSGNTIGPADAQVVVMEFSDFQCPHCKSFAEGTARQLFEEYVKPGLIRFEFKYFPLPGFEPGATWAANAAACAADQGKFWEMHDYLFQEQGKQGPNTFTQNRLRNMAKELGLDTGQFNSCLSREEHQQEILQSANLGRELGVTGTPSVFVNGQKVESSYAQIKAAIDAALEQASAG